MDEDLTSVVEQAERIIYHARWRIHEQAALDALAGTTGLRWAPLEPRSDVIQLVTYNGEHLGHVRRDGPAGSGQRWVAVRCQPGRAVGRFASIREAAAALARACGKDGLARER
jgi:hypothetical protein